MVNYLDGLLDHAARQPRAPALSLPERTLGHGEFAASLAGVSAGLAALGLPTGAVVAVALRDQAAILRAVLGILLGGRVAMPFDPAATPDDLGGLLGRAGAVAAITEEPAALPRGLRPIAPAGLPPAADPFALRHDGGGDWAQIAITSGTTGPSKAVPATHAQMLERTRSLEPLLGLGPDDRHFALVNLVYSYARHSAVRMLDLGGAVVLRPLPQSVPELIALLRAERVGYASVTPSHVHTLLEGLGPETDGVGPALPDMKAFSVAGSQLPLADRLAARRRLTPNLHIHYGSNEGGLITHAGPDELDLAPGCVGRVVPGLDVEVVDDGARVAPGTVGEIRFRGPQVSSGYLDGSAGFRDGWFHPGDTGWLDRHGLLHLAGRVDDRINSGGRKIYPFEVEAVLGRHPAVAECAVFGVPSRRFQEVVGAAIVLCGAVTPTALRAHCLEHLAAYKVPVRFLNLERLPRNATGKVLVRQLRADLAPHVG